MEMLMVSFGAVAWQDTLCWPWAGISLIRSDQDLVVALEDGAVAQNGGYKSRKLCYTNAGFNEAQRTDPLSISA